MTSGESLQIALIRKLLKSAHWLLEETTIDVTVEMAHWPPPGIALPIGAAFAHYVTSEDWMVNVPIRGGVPLFAGRWAGKTGLSVLPPGPGEATDWSAEFAAWSRLVRIDLPAFRAYARAVFDETDAWLATAADADLGRTLDLSAAGMGTQKVGFVLGNVLIGHAYCHCGEISALKGIQGKRGYPF